MLAQDVMRNQVYKVKEDDTVRSVIEKFIEHGISGIPVVNHHNEIAGFVSDGDIMRYIGKHRDIVIDNFWSTVVMNGDDEDFSARVKHVLTLNVLEIAKRKVITAQWDEEVENIAAILGQKQIKKIPIERDGVLVGMISRGDVIRNVFRSFL